MLTKVGWRSTSHVIYCRAFSSVGIRLRREDQGLILIVILSREGVWNSNRIGIWTNNMRQDNGNVVFRSVLSGSPGITPSEVSNKLVCRGVNDFMLL